MKWVVALLLSTIAVLVLVGSSGSANAVTSTTESLAEPAACAFKVSFAWSGFSGGGQSDVAQLRLYSGDGSTTSLLSYIIVHGVPVRLFSISHTFMRTASGTSLTFTDFVALYNSTLKTLFSNFTNSISDNCT